ncbi:Ger(x)C family spore germination protein [uncultured Paenibacillus sp.]|uniref:Ger(x)C family spore germination protein n=1 Tax=uncultured Paenibacillus sp. TaxID=227322 RepID=UPI0015A840B2|nr:Ger(x)C family spore germination protein [uncultured Paenibacillus sp.]
MRRFWLCCVSVILCVISSGCWNRMELNELGITVATGFDREGDDWVLSYQVIVPSASGASQGGGATGGGNQPSVYVFSTKGKTIREAADRGYLENPRQLYFAHTDIMVIGKEAAKAGIDQILDLYFRNIDARETVLVSVTDETAADILRKMVPPEKIPGTALADMLRKQANFSSYYPVVKVYQLAQQLVSDARTAGVPEITVTKGNKKALESLDINKTTSPPVKMKISRLAVFQDDRLVGYLDRQQSYGISWLTDRVKGSTLSFLCSRRGPEGESRGSVRITSAKTKVTPVKEGGHYKMQVRTEAKGDLLMEYMCGEDLTKPGAISRLERIIADEIVNAIDTGWKASQKLQVDLPGFADKIHRKDPKGWKELEKNWNQELAGIQLDIQVKMRLQRPGLFKKSFDILTKQAKAEDGT